MSFQFADLKRRLVVAACSVGALVMMSVSAVAAPIGHTSFGIAGGFTIPAGTHLGNTDSITITNGGQIFVTAGDMFDLAGIVNFGNTGTLQNIPSLSAFVPITSYLSLASGVSLDLNTLTIINRTGPTPGFLNISGDGVLHAPGFDATSGVFTWTGTTSDNMQFTFAVTASAQTFPVPEPFSVMLLGLGLVGVSFTRRRFSMV